MQEDSPTHACVCTHVCTHVCTDARAHACAYACTHACASACTHVLTPVCNRLLYTYLQMSASVYLMKSFMGQHTYHVQAVISAGQNGDEATSGSPTGNACEGVDQMQVEPSCEQLTQSNSSKSRTAAQGACGLLMSCMHSVTKSTDCQFAVLGPPTCPHTLMRLLLHTGTRRYAAGCRCRRHCLPLCHPNHGRAHCRPNPYTDLS